MSPNESERKLLQGVLEGDFEAVEAALAAGADVNGSPEQPLPALAAAVMANHFGMVAVLLGKGADAVLLGKGADPDRPVPPVEVSRPELGITTHPGERALHIAARSGRAVIVRLLLKRARADPNATDDTGATPLWSTCDSTHVRVEVVRLLLEAGADASMAPVGGWSTMHIVAASGYMELVDMLYAAAPATLNSCAALGVTPLCAACTKDQESMVSRLLSLGAMQPMPLNESTSSPLSVAVGNGFVGVVHLLLEEKGFRAIGGELALPSALLTALHFRQTRTLRLLLAAEGEEKRSAWANTRIGDNRHLLHIGAAYCYPAAVSVLLEAGADEAALGSQGRTPRGVIGAKLGRNGKAQMDRGGEVAIRRMLQRGPAYRARSWAWPVAGEGGAAAVGRGDGDDGGGGEEEEEEEDGDGDGDDDDDNDDDCDDDDDDDDVECDEEEEDHEDDDDGGGGVLSSPPAMKNPHNIGVRIFRPKEKSSSKFFVGLIGRYCAKD